MITYCTSAAGTPLRASAPAMAVPPRVTASTPASAEESRPIGVLAPATITVDPMTSTLPSRRYRLPMTSPTGTPPTGTPPTGTPPTGTSPTGGLPTDLRLLGIDHVGIAVTDLDAAIAFHTGVLGGTLSHRETNVDQGVEEAMISYGAGAQVQLLAPAGPESTIAKFLDRNGPGLQQLAYRVDDVDAVSQQLRDRGLRVLFDGARRGTAGSRVNFVHPRDAGGVLVELVEPASRGHAADAVPGPRSDGTLTA
jgi:methylmalonyl-CoA/ethylmalonyl-CoA epimerase